MASSIQRENHSLKHTMKPMGALKILGTKDVQFNQNFSTAKSTTNPEKKISREELALWHFIPKNVHLSYLESLGSCS